MKCAMHQTTAIGICSHCGIAICDQCSYLQENNRLTCSPACMKMARQLDKATEMLLKQSKRAFQNTAVFMLIMGLLFIFTGFYIYFVVSNTPLGGFVLVAGMIFSMVAPFYLRVVKREEGVVEE